MTSQFLDPVLRIVWKIWKQYFRGVKQEYSFKLGKKMSFHSNRGYCLRTQDFCSWIGSRPSKVSIIKTLLPPTTVKGIKSFLRHVGFYRRFIKDFLKISRPLEKDVKFDFNELCKATFHEIKSRLVTTPIMVILDWNTDF